MTEPELQRRFNSQHELSYEVKMLRDMMRDQVFDLAQDINKHVPEGREKACAFTALEEVQAWINAAFDRGP